MSKRKLLLSGATIAELRKECMDFLKETHGMVPTEPSQPTTRTASATQAIETQDFSSPHIASNDPVHEIENPFGNNPPPPILEMTMGNVFPAAADAAPILTKTATPNATTHSSPGTVTDSKGMPWDGRIHSANESKNKDGSWRYRRNLDETTIAQVEAELRGLDRPVIAPPVSAPIQTPQPPSLAVVPPTVVASPIAPVPAAPAIGTPSPQSVGPSAVPSEIPQPQTITSAHTLETFKAGMPMVVAGLVKDGKLTQEYINAVLRHCGVAQLWEMNETQIGQFFEMLVKNNLITKVV